MFKTLLRFIGVFIFNILEWLCRIIYLALPFGVHLFIMQMRERVDSVTTLTTFVSPDSKWAVVYNGVVLVNTNPGAVKGKINSFKFWLKKNAPIFLALGIIVIISLLGIIAYKIIK